MGEHKTIIERIREGDSFTLSSLYNKALPYCGKYIYDNSATIEEVEDTFSEIMIDFTRKIQRTPDLKIPDEALLSYLYEWTRRVWQGKLRNKKTKPRMENFEDSLQLDGLENNDINNSEHIYMDILKETFDELRRVGSPCPDILTILYTKGLKLKDLAEDFDYSEGFIRQKSKRCKEQVKSIIEEKLKNQE